MFSQLEESGWRGEAAEEGAARDPLPGALSRDRGAAKASVANLPKVRPWRYNVGLWPLRYVDSDR